MKIHACVDALGNPLRLILTGGQVADVTQGAALITGIPTTVVSADKGYDSDKFGQNHRSCRRHSHSQYPASQQSNQ
jgi:transposase